jgi:type III pantothenate kinase
MTPSVVVDVGNSRLKWGRCTAIGITESCSLPLDAPTDWVNQLRTWELLPTGTWVVAGVNPPMQERFVRWLRQEVVLNAAQLLEFKRFDQIGIQTSLPFPERVGLDRLLNAAAVDTGPALLVDAGSAVTVDYVDEARRFRGGAILPGLRLMARALNGYTAKLPLVEVDSARVSFPAEATEPAIQSGILAAVVGGIRWLADRMPLGEKVRRYLTGGDAALLAPLLGVEYTLWPNMTLEGIRWAALRMEV